MDAELEGKKKVHCNALFSQKGLATDLFTHLLIHLELEAQISLISDINDFFDLCVLQVATSVCRKTKALFSADVDLPLLCAFIKQMDTFEDITIVNDL